MTTAPSELRPSHMTRYFEDFEIGETIEYGSHTVTEEEIVEFGERFDPQPFHVDPEAAEESMFGGLIASGWHTASVCQRMAIESRPDAASVGGRGVDELRWHQPVFPSDTLSITVEVLDKRPSESDPEIGHIDVKITGWNQDDAEVVSWVVLAMYERRGSS